MRNRIHKNAFNEKRLAPTRGEEGKECFMKSITVSLFIAITLMQAWPTMAQQPTLLKPILEVESHHAGWQLGRYVAGVGDLNKDGYADVAVSAPGIYKTFIYYGGKTMSQTPSVTLKGGGPVVSGDFLGNGWIDLAIDIPFHDSVLVYYNGPNGLDTIPDVVLTMNSDYFGNVMTTGDFFGNGYTDIAIGTLDENEPSNKEIFGRGRIFIYGDGPFENLMPLDTISGDTENAGLGSDLTSGDVYNNGEDALIALGYNQLMANESDQYYYIQVFVNNAGHLRSALNIDSRNIPGGFGGVGGGGDIACFDADGDGIPDILVSGICIFKGGSTIDTLPSYRVGPPRGDTSSYGTYPWVGGGGDYNGDGIPDILLASERGVYGTTSGVFVMLDGRGHPGQFKAYRIYADSGDGLINLSGNPANAGDVNGGGVDDIIIGNGGWPYPAYNGFFGIYSGDTSLVAGVKEHPAPPEQFILNQNYPNPFNPSTVISYQLSTVSHVTLKIYDALGREVKTLINDEEESPGTHSVVWNGTDRQGDCVSSGVYFYQLTTDEGTQTKKAVYLK